MKEKLNYMKRWGGGVFLLLMVFSLNATAQVQVRGLVLDELGEPAIGATIQIKGTNQGTVTDMDGAFSISAPAGSMLVISYVGYQTQEVIAAVNVRVHLQADSEMLDELVVVGYGTMRRSDLTGSVSQARGADIIRGQSFDALAGLQGRAAGVNIFGNTGQPGGETRVIIRGIATVNTNTSPLYVVDGVVMSNLQFLNPNDIESIEVLKDASSAAIYGARGANGVILVTTKRGGDTGSRSRISYSGSASVSQAARYMELANSEQYMAMFKQGLENANAWYDRNFDTDLSKIFTDTRFFQNGKPIYDTDWQREMHRTAFSNNHQISIQRGDRNQSVGAFLNYTDQQGILLNTYQKRVNMRLAYDDKPTKWLSTSNNLSVNHAWGNRTSDNPYGMDVTRTMIEMFPFFPVMLDGEYVQTNTMTTTAIPRDKDNPTGATQGFSPEAFGNPVEAMKRIENVQYRTQIFGNTAFTFHLAPDLSIRTQFGVEYRINRSQRYEPRFPRPMLGYRTDGRAVSNTQNLFYWQEETFLNYRKVLERHRINAMAGASWSGFESVTFNANQNNFEDDYFGTFNLFRGIDRPAGEHSHNMNRMNSYFARFVYSLDDKYMVTLTGRVDGSSKFGANNKYAFFPSIGLGWNAQNEDFLKDNAIISRLKPRTSYGITGNSEISSFQSLATITQGSTIINDALVITNVAGRMANQDLRWEKTATWDAGVELGLFNDRLNFEVSYYHRYTSDLLMSRPLPLHTGFASIMYNVGEVSNRGIDLLITATPVSIGDFHWSTTINAGWNKNRVEKLDPSTAVDPATGKRQITTDGWVDYQVVHREGAALSSWYGLRRAGIYDGVPGNWDAETMNIPARIGERVTYKQREIIGNGLPKVMGSFNNTLSYKNFDFTAELQFSLGAQIMQEFFHSTVGRFYNNVLGYVYEEAWHPVNNPNGKEQAIRLNNFGQGQNANADDSWVVSGNYLRGSLLQFGYTFNRSALQKLDLASLRIYANVNNAFLITHKNFLGYDPDNSTRLTQDNWNWGANRQFMSYPRPRTYTLGLMVTF